MVSLSVFSLEIIGNLKKKCAQCFSNFLIKIKTIFLNLAFGFTFIQCLRTVRLYLSLSGPAQPPPSPTPSPALLPELRIKPREKRRTYGKVLPGASSPLYLHSRKHLLLHHALPHIYHLRLRLCKKEGWKTKKRVLL